MRALLMLTLLLVFSASAAHAQETTGAGRMEVAAFPGGGIIFAESNDPEAGFGNYTVGGAFTWNFNRWIGVEGEVGNAVGVKQTIEVNGVTLPSQHSPCFFGYNANAVLNPFGNDRSLVPYGTVGIGGLRMLDTDEVAELGVTAPANYLTANAGGGVKWFATRHWGARADYRMMRVTGNSSAPAFFARDGARYGHRIYGGLLFTY